MAEITAVLQALANAAVSASMAGTTVRNVLDMATGVDCTENYEDVDSCYYQYSMAIGDNLRTEDAPDNRGNRSEKTHDLFTAEVCFDEGFVSNTRPFRMKF